MATIMWHCRVEAKLISPTCLFCVFEHSDASARSNGPCPNSTRISSYTEAVWDEIPGGIGQGVLSFTGVPREGGGHGMSRVVCCASGARDRINPDEWLPGPLNKILEGSSPYSAGTEPPLPQVVPTP